MKTKTILRIVLSSPSDVEPEHKIVARVVDEINRDIAEHYHARFELIHWKTDAYPGFNVEGPQGLIDPILNIENADILIGLFWKRFGTPTTKAGSGTEHEFLTALKSWRERKQPQIMMYFKEKEFLPKTVAEAEQYALVLQFKEEFPSEGLYWTFKEDDQFERLLRHHLAQYLKTEFKAAQHALPAEAPATEGKAVIRAHCETLKARFSTINLFGDKSGDAQPAASGIARMGDVATGFVPLFLKEWLAENDTRQTTPLQIEELFFNQKTAFHYLIRGLPGSGKTTLLRYLAYRFACQGTTNDGKEVIPVYMRCKAMRLDQNQLENLVLEQINDDCASRKQYLALTCSERFLETPMILLLDGLDEIEHPPTSEIIGQELVRLRKKFPRCKLIVTSRPIGLKREEFPGFQPLDLLPLTDEIIRDYLIKWFGDNSDSVNKLQKMLEQKPRIGTLARNPFLLSMICFTYEQGGDTALIERRSDLYATCTRYLLERRYDPEHSPCTEQDYEQTLKLLKDLSWRFFLWQEAHFPVDQVNVLGKQLLKADLIGETEDCLDQVQRQTGLLQRAKEGFTFVHRSLWEYFTALSLLDKKAGFVIRHAANPDWEEVVRLYAGLLPEEDDIVALVAGLWNINRPLALRVTTEVHLPAVKLIKPLIKAEEDNQSRLLLIDSLEQSLPLIDESQRRELLNETLSILLVDCEERDCEVIYHAEQLLRKQHLQPLEPGGLIHRLFDLEHAAARQKKLLDDAENCFQWIKVSGGTFLMGDEKHGDEEKPAHKVKLDTFYMTKHPVTNRLLASFPFGNKYPNYGGETHPAIGNTWYEAYYCAIWLGARLPAEAEWEFAARGGRGGKHTQYYFGDDANDLPDHAWFGDVERRVAHAVDERNPRTGKENLNPLGLANMHGNVWEWCQDTWHGNYEGAPSNGSAWETGESSYRVLRGGCWSNYAQYCRSARRNNRHPDYRSYVFGFRLVFVP
ncbi:SUMF1/EgtB/PvdO family nonheme iron enzyme, partial [candidate division KSB1 bacterium]|nr:SUMF1/EgtB/PvdO family nonheme iron enzyme [candidate division KSB1 bacterium]